MPDRDTTLPPIPEAKEIPRHHTRLSLVWVIPVVAALAGAWIAITRVMDEGPKITIVFNSAEGLEAGKTKIQYNGVEVGTLTKVRLSDDHRHVITTAQMAPKTENFLVHDTKFWVVRPRISGANVTGLGTLISGAYIGMEIGASKEDRRDFVALETQPIISGGVPGRFFVLKTPDLGSLDNGTPIFFRRLQVGQVASFRLDKDGKLFTVKAFVEAPYDQYVTPDTRFWHASGIDVSLSASGIALQTQSMLSIMIGGIAFETPPSPLMLPPAAENTSFTLFANRTEAFEPAARNPQTYMLNFKESVQGLTPGAPVMFRGVQIGEVSEVRAQLDLKNFTFSVPVTIRLDPQRLGVQIIDFVPGMDMGFMRRRLIDSLVAHGLRAQIRSGNLLTGSSLVAFDVFPDAAPATVDWTQDPPQLPTVPGELQELEASVSNIVKKLDKLPLNDLSKELRTALGNLNLALLSAQGTLVTAQGALGSARGTFSQANNLIGQNSVQVQQINATLQEVSRAARSLRVLADYLERHPEALIRGKKGEAQ